MATSGIPPYLHASPVVSGVPDGSHGLKKNPSFLMDASMGSVGESLTSMRDDSNGYLFYEDHDDISCSSDMTEDDSDDEEDDSDDESSSEEDSDSEASLDHGEGGLMADHEIIQSMSTLRRGMQRVRSANSLRSMLSNGSVMSLNPSTPADQVKRRMMERSRRKAEQRSNPSCPNGQGQLQPSNSIGNMQVLKQQQAAADQAARKKTLRETASVGHIGQKLSAQKISKDDGAAKPDDHLKELLGGTPMKNMPYNDDSLEGFFLDTKPEYVAAWTNEITKAVRDHNLKALEDMHLQGHRLQACNQFGESVVHLCVRRGTPEMLQFLLQDAGVSMRVCCENGRTPMHDAAWCLSDNPKSYQMLMILLAESPMMLYITDKRGFTPLCYVSRARWAECNAFLDKQYAKGRLSALQVAN